MSLPRARTDSNAPGGGADNAPSTGELGMVGFTHVPYEKFKPATSNSDVPSSGDDNNRFSLGQDGTSVGAYEFQPEILNADTMAQLSVASKGQKKP
jgi:hypothetical protein